MTRRGVAAAALASVALHAGAAWLLLPHPSRDPGVPDRPPAIEVELVDQAQEERGAEAARADPAPPPPEPNPTAPPSLAGGTLPPPIPEAPVAPPRPLARAAVNLGSADEDRDSLLVTGRNVVPPRPDASFHNKPPGYPADAARRGSHGTVQLRIHVTEAGVPSGVDVAATSGDTSLDRAAVDAVALWRFQPARNNGAAVPFDYDLDVTFRR